MDYVLNNIMGDVIYSSENDGVKSFVVGHGDGAATWQSKTVVTGVSETHTSAGWLYGDSSLTPTGRSNSRMIHSVTATTATINYLGAADS